MPTHLGDIWADTVRQAPQALAVIDGASGDSWTRAALAQAAAAWGAAQPLAATLTGRRVILAEPNGLGWWRAFLGLLARGAVPVMLDATEPAAGRRAIAEAIGAVAIVAEGRLEPVAGRPRRRENFCLIKLTSGSTGTPQALAFTHAQMLADGRQVCATMDIRPDDLNLAVIPLGHSYGLGNLVVPLLAQGTAMVCAASPLPQALAADCARWRPTVFPAVPTLLRALVRSEIAPAMLASLRTVISAGAVLAPELAGAFAEKFGRRVQGFYGASETGGITFDRTGEATLTGRSVGTPLAGVRLEFRSGQRFTVVSAAVGGRGRFSPKDRGELTATGELVLRGRVGRLVKIAGRRIDLAEVEKALREIAGVRDAYALVHPTKAEALAVGVATDLPVAVVRAALARRLAPWKIPDRWLVLPDFPTTARGKLDLPRLRALVAAG